jgi:hypothetical protein
VSVVPLEVPASVKVIVCVWLTLVSTSDVLPLVASLWL